MHRKEGKQWPDIHAIYRYQQIYIHIFISLCFHQLEAEIALNPVSSGSVFCSTQFLRSVFLVDALTLIGYALGFLVHLLLKTILHHDALTH